MPCRSAGQRKPLIRSNPAAQEQSTSRVEALGFKALGDYISAGDLAIQSRKNRAVCPCELPQMAVRCLFPCPHPCGQTRNVVIIGNEVEFHRSRCLQANQQVPGLNDSEPVLGGLCEDANETEFSNGAGRQFSASLVCHRTHPGGDPPVELVLKKSERNEGVDIEQVRHGDSSKISRTCLLVSMAASSPAVSTGSPVIWSIRTLAFRERVLRGVNTTCPACTFASSESPG